jgi:hypothetical protein
LWLGGAIGQAFAVTMIRRISMVSPALAPVGRFAAHAVEQGSH